MSHSPVFWGIGLASALAGAVAGTSLGSSPLIAADTSAMYFQTHRTSTGSASAGGNAALPDRYPLVTREGVVPVAALSQRGLYRQARNTAVDAPAPAMAYDRGSDITVERAARQSAEDSNRVSDERFEQVMEAHGDGVATPAPPLALAKGPVVVAHRTGSAKIVSVADALATP